MLSNILNNTLSSYTYSNLYPIMHDILGNIKKNTLSCYTYSELYPIVQDILENIYKKYPIMLYILECFPYYMIHIKKISLLCLTY